MDISYEQLSHSLKQELKPVYLISSDEHLLLQEACQQIIDAAKQQSFSEKETFNVERGFKWQALLDANSSMSLFGDKKIIELRIPSGKADKTGSAAILDYLSNASPDNLLLIRCPQLKKSDQNVKWIQAIKQQGAFCLIWKINPKQLPQWIQRRGASFKLNIDRDAAQIIAERIEGNLLAASQEIEKLSLIYPENSGIGSKEVMQLVANNSRYDVYAMAECAINRDSKKALQMFRGLREERTDLTIIAWAIRKEIETLLAIMDLSQNQPMPQVFKELRIWKTRESFYNKALKRFNNKELETHLSSLAKLDKTIKGRAAGSAEDLCEQVLLAISETRTVI